MELKQQPSSAVKAEKGNKTVTEAGKSGGLRTLELYGIGHYRAAGRKGQAAFADRYSADDRRRWGTLGGQPRRTRFTHGGEKAYG